MVIKQAEIWRVDLNPTIGDEMQKIRTCLVVSDNGIGKLKLKTVVPVTGWQDAFAQAPWMVKISPTMDNGLSKTSSADTFQIRSISEKRFIEKIGFIDERMLFEIHGTIVKTLNPRYSIIM